MRPSPRHTAWILPLLLSPALSAAPRRQVPPAAPSGLDAALLDLDAAELSLEELMDIDVTIATRSKEKLSAVPAAVYVLTGDEIRRAGHSSIPEALRMVPGFYVSRWSHVAWDVTSRGFGTGLSLTSLAYLNQLLVMIDGVVVYSPLFAGVWWPIQDVDMADIDRIEVVRGPGGVLWGSNAVHGVVHVITKRASETQGPRVTVRAGTDDDHASVRWGLPLGERGHLRVWVDGADYDTLHNPFLGINSNWNLGSLGMRGDWRTESGIDLTVWGRLYYSDFDEIAFDLTTFEPFLGDGSKDGRVFFASASHPERGWHAQAWYTRDRHDIPTLADIDIDTFDAEFHRESPLGESNTLTYGLGVRQIHSRLTGDDPFYLDFEPSSVTQNNFRGFLLDTIRFPQRNLTVILGAQLVHNEFTDLEVQPTGRILWAPAESINLWAAVSRPVRTPSLEERTLSADSVIVGSSLFESENALIYELGVRKRFSPRLAADVALFYNDYDDLHFEEEDPATGQFLLTNDGEGEAFGAELAVDAQPAERWRLRGAYSFLEGDFRNAVDGSPLDTDAQSPKHIFNLRSYLDLGEDWELDGAVYLVEGMGEGFEVAEYLRTDVRLGWRPSEKWRFSVGAQGFNDPTHSEFDEFDNTRRSFFFEAQWTP